MSIYTLDDHLRSIFEDTISPTMEELIQEGRVIPESPGFWKGKIGAGARQGQKNTKSHNAKIGKANSISQKGNTNGAGNKGKTIPDDVRKRTSETMKRNGIKPPSAKGRTRTPETKERMRQAAILREAKKRLTPPPFLPFLE